MQRLREFTPTGGQKQHPRPALATIPWQDSCGDAPQAATWRLRISSLAVLESRRVNARPRGYDGVKGNATGCRTVPVQPYSGSTDGSRRRILRVEGQTPGTLPAVMPTRDGLAFPAAMTRGQCEAAPAEPRSLPSGHAAERTDQGVTLARVVPSRPRWRRTGQPRQPDSIAWTGPLRGRRTRDRPDSASGDAETARRRPSGSRRHARTAWESTLPPPGQERPS